MNKAIPVLFLAVAIGIFACDTTDSIAPLSDSFFVKFYAGISEGDQFGEDIIATTDGGLLIAATSRNTDGSSEILLIKTDEKGNELWTYGASGDLAEPISVAKSVIELPGSYLVGGTVSTGNLDRSILMEVDFNGNLVNYSLVYTDSANNTVPVSNRLSKVTIGESGILVSGETNHFAGKADGINGFMGLFDADLDTIPKSTGANVYFGLNGDDIITGAYEVLDTLGYGDPLTPTHFLVFGSAQNIDVTKGYDFFYADFNSDYSPNTDVQPGIVPKAGDQKSAYVTREEGQDNFWMIGETDTPGLQMFMIGWFYNNTFWDTKYEKGDIGNSEGVAGKGITVQSFGNQVIVGDSIDDPGVHTEIQLSRVDQFGNINAPWPKNYGAVTSTYSSSAVITLQDGSIVIVGTADLQPIKKVLVIKTGPNGEMSF